MKHFRLIVHLHYYNPFLNIKCIELKDGAKLNKYDYYYNALGIS